MKYPALRTVKSVIIDASETSVCVNGKYVPARSYAWPSTWRRFKYAWMVFTGKADALIWEGQ